MSRFSGSEHDSPAQGVSLEELREAYARAMGFAVAKAEVRPEARPQPAAAREPSESGVGGATAGPLEEEAATAPGAGQARHTPTEAAAGPARHAQSEPLPADAADTACPIGPLSVLEAMLFVGNRDNQPLSACQAAELLRGVEAEEIPDLVRQLNARYAASGCPYEIVAVRGGYRMALRAEFGRLRRRFDARQRRARLSQAAVDVLAIVAYKQPVTAEQVSQLRGKPSGHILAQLVHRGLLQIERKGDGRRVAHYRTTERFLRMFGLASLDELPRSEESAPL